MILRWCRLSAVLCLTCVLYAQPTGLKSHAVPVGALAGEEIRAQAAGRPDRVYRLARSAGIESLGAFEVRTLHSLADGWKLISAREGIDGAAPGELYELREKMSPLLVSEDGRGGGRSAVVEFYSDVEPAAARRTLSEAGVLVRDHPDVLDHQFVVEMDALGAARLAAREEVAWIFPASDELTMGQPVRACVGALTEDGPVGSYTQKIGEGWDGPGRGAASLRYAFQSLTAQLPEDAIRAEFLRALEAWSRVAQVDFEAGGDARSTRHLNILFGSGPHGDPFPFDGRGRTLAHTFFPSPPNPEPVAGDVHFDDDEPWRMGADVDYFSVALHEIGHALGLGHSDRPGAVMYAYYRMATGLTAEDIGAIRELYATRQPANEPPTSPHPPVEPTPPAPAPPQNPAPIPPAPAPPVNPPSTPPATPPSNPATPDRTAPTIRILSPASSSIVTSSPAIHVHGTASDDRGVARVTWSSRAGNEGVAEGTADWSAINVPLMMGTNYFIFRAYDAAGNSAWRSITIVRR